MFQAGTETLSKTNLDRLHAGNAVNLDRSLPVNGRLGGHFVQGHVDGIGLVDRIDHDGDWVTMWFRVPEALANLMVSKGSIAVDGISLTLVNECGTGSIQRRPDPAYSECHNASGLRQASDPVNIETDIPGQVCPEVLEVINGALKECMKSCEPSGVSPRTGIKSPSISIVGSHQSQPVHRKPVER